MQLSSPLYTLGPADSPLWQGNALDASDCAWIVENEAGWSSTPPVRPAKTDKTIGDGTWAGEGWYSGRLVTLTGRCVAPDQVSMLWAKEAVKTAIGPHSLVQLRVDELHLSRTAMVRLDDQVDITDQGPLAFKWQMGLFADDPRRYSAAQQSQTCVLPGPGTENGRGYPRAYPLLYTGGGASGASDVVITQAGNYDLTPAVIVIRGPVINPEILHQPSGAAMILNVTVGYSQYLVIDLGEQSALLNGLVSVAQQITSTSAWFMLSPGENMLFFRGEAGMNADGSPGEPSMTVTASSAWS